VLSALAAACVTGVLFQLWPTSANDHSLVLQPQTFARLEGLRMERKFYADAQTMYEGAPNERVRIQAQQAVDAIIASVHRSITVQPRRSAVLGALKRELPRLDALGPREKDEALHYVERLVATIGVAGTGELLNVWRYGVPLDFAYSR
jgi:hypothetical protein